ncbi:MAG: hypothetical protein R3Y22_04485 [Bacteroidales bacterium]
MIFVIYDITKINKGMKSRAIIIILFTCVFALLTSCIFPVKKSKGGGKQPVKVEKKYNNRR